MPIINPLKNTVSYSMSELKEVSEALKSANEIAIDSNVDSEIKLTNIRLELNNLRQALMIAKY
jgi:hypothetical protein